MQYILTGVIVLIFSGLVIHGLSLLLERGIARFSAYSPEPGCPRKFKMKISR